MKKLPLLLLLLLPLSLHAQTTPVTGKLQDIGVVNITSSNSFVRFELRGYGGNIPRVAGSAILGSVEKQFFPDSNGDISGTLYSNNFITPSSTFYRMCIFDAGRRLRCADYLIQGSSFDMSLATPISSAPTPTPPSFESRVFTHIQTSASTTWTIVHNFGVREVTLDFYNASFERIFPDLVALTDSNTVTAGFVVAQAGRAVVMRAENVMLSSATGDFVLKTPTTAQSITGGFDLTLAGSFLPSSLFTKNANNTRFADQFAGADAGAKITACIAALPSTGGTCDARGLEGAQTISSTITVNKPVQILLGYATYTTSASPAFDFTEAGDFSSLIGVGIGNTSGIGGTQITAASSGVMPLIRLEGTNGTTRITRVRLAHFQLNGTDTLDGQTGILFNFFTGIELENVQFSLLGQAEDIDAGALIYHDRVAYDRCGTAGTPATACVRVENRSDPGGTQLNQIRWTNSIWQGDSGAGNNKQGTAVYFNGVEVSTVWILDSFFELNTNADFPLVVFDSTQFAQFGGNTVSANTVTSANAVVDVTGDATDRAASIQIFNNRISFSDTVPGVRLDWGQQNTVNGGVFRGNGGGTAIEITSNHLAGVVGPFEMASADAPVSNSSTAVVTLFREQTSGNTWYMPEGLAVGATPATSGDIRLSSGGIIRSRDSGDSANINVILLNASDQVEIGQAGANARIVGTLGVGNIAPQARGIIIPNNEEYWMLDSGGASVAGMKVDGSDIQRIGDDADLASIVLGRTTVPTAIGGALEYRDAPTLAASTTPSVAGGNVFLTNNTASITDFADEQNGQVIILLCGADTTTSLTDSTPLFLTGAFTCTSNDTITLVSNGTVWYEIARSVN